MGYSANYVDEHGKKHVISITDNESREALKNDYNKIIKKYNPEIVNIERMMANRGEELHLKINVNAPSDYLESQDDSNPKPCNPTPPAEIIVYLGYPLKAIKAFYPNNRFLASLHVWNSGIICIDHWILLTSSLETVTEKIIMDMIHNPMVVRYDSMANRHLEKWYREGVSSGRFPTINPAMIYASKEVPLPARNERAMSSAVPALPVRNRTNL